MSVPERPGAVTALAIINIVLGSLALLLSLCGGVVLVAGQDMIRDDPNAAAMDNFFRQQVPAYQLMQGIGISVLLLEGAALLATGIGLLKLGNWARVTAIWFAVLSLVWVVVQAVYYFAFVAPAQERFFRDVGIAGLGQGISPRLLATLSTIVQVALWLAVCTYAIILISVLSRRRVRDVFAGVGGPDDDLDRYTADDDDWFEKRRRRDARADGE